MPAVSKSSSNFTIEDFKSSIFSRGIGRHTRFEVMVFPPNGALTEYMDAKAISLRCHKCDTPHLEMETTDYRVGQGQPRKAVHNFNHGHKLTMSFYVDTGRDLYNGFMQWMNKAFPFYTITCHDVGWYDDYTGQAVIRQLDETDTVRHEWTLFEVYPIKVERIHLDADMANKAIELEVELAYRRAFNPPNGWDGTSPVSSVVDGATKNAIAASTGAIDSNGDPTMQGMARRTVTKPTAAELAAALSRQIGLTDSNYVTINNRFAEWPNTMSTAQDVINNPNATPSDAQNSHNALSSKLGEYRTLRDVLSSNAMKAQQGYDSIKNTLPSDSDIPSKITEMQGRYKAVSGNVLNNENQFNSVAAALQKIISPPATIVATAG